MAGMRISELDFLRLLPAFMRDDEAVIALSKAVDKLMGETLQRRDTLRTWDKIDGLNEDELDALAWELDVDWYDSEGMDLEQKRATIKLAQQIKRKRGTKWSVERLISAYFGEGYVMEWFEMYGEPYTFAALTTNEHTDAAGFEKFMEAVRAAKNVRSHIAGVFYFWQQGPDPGVQYALGSSMHRYNFRRCGTYPRRATVGFILKPGIEVDPEALAYLYGFTRAGTIDCGTYPRPGTLGAAQKQGVAVGPDPGGLAYNFARRAGVYPRPGTLGQVIRRAVTTVAQGVLNRYGFTRAGNETCGTFPVAATLGAAVEGKIAATAEADGLAYKIKRRAGTYPLPGTLGVTQKQALTIEPETAGLTYKIGRRAGVYKPTGMLGAADVHMATATPAAALAGYKFVRCGTRRCGE